MMRLALALCVVCLGGEAVAAEGRDQCEKLAADLARGDEKAAAKAFPDIDMVGDLAKITAAVKGLGANASFVATIAERDYGGKISTFVHYFHGDDDLYFYCRIHKDAERWNIRHITFNTSFEAIMRFP